MLEKYSTDHNIVHYADFSSWTGDSIPKPATCPIVSGFQVCGGNCGGCPAGDICAGRSPLHPIGVCVPINPPNEERWDGDAGAHCIGDAGDGLFVFTVDPPSQDMANLNGRCMPLATCQAMAAQLPGGGTCVAQP